MENASPNDIVIQFAIERMNSRKCRKRPPCTIDFKPEDFKDFVKSKEELKAVLGRKWKHTLADIGRFSIKYQHITSNYRKKHKDGSCHPVELLPIACTSSYLLDLFETPHPRYACRLLKKCKDIGLLVEVDSAYRFNCHDPSKNRCKIYAYNKDVEHLIIRLCKEERIEIKEESYIYHPILDTFEGADGLTDDEYERITLRNDRLNIRNCNIDILRDIIWVKYFALINPRWQKIEEMNEELPPEQRIRFTPNPTYGKKSLRRISIRATSKIVSYKVDKRTNPLYKGIYRADYLEEYFEGKPYFHYDIKGSIFQVSHLLNYGEWYGNKSNDPYEVIYEAKFDSNEARSAYKLLAMSLYFDNEKMIYAHSLYDTLKTNERYGKYKVKSAIAMAVDKMRSFTGNSLYNEIFLHESLLYIDFVYELRRRGIKVVQIYDGFYLPVGYISSDELEQLMHECAMKYLDDYRKWLTDSPLRKYNNAA